MGVGKMDQRIKIVSTTISKNARGFREPTNEPDGFVANVWAYKEAKHASEFWAIHATYAKATHMFKFRCIPGTEVTEDMVIIHKGQRYNILSTEDVRDRGMYVIALAEGVKPSKGV